MKSQIDHHHHHHHHLTQYLDGVGAGSESHRVVVFPREQNGAGTLLFVKRILKDLSRSINTQLSLLLLLLLSPASFYNCQISAAAGFQGIYDTTEDKWSS